MIAVSTSKEQYMSLQCFACKMNRWEIDGILITTVASFGEQDIIIGPRELLKCGGTLAPLVLHPEFTLMSPRVDLPWERGYSNICSIIQMCKLKIPL